MVVLLQNRIVKNSAWIIGIKIVQSVITFFIGIFTARYLGPSNYGIISYASSIVAFVIPIMQLGITNILVQYLVLNKDKEGEIIGSSITICVLSSIFCVVGVTAFSAIVDAGEQETTLVCFLYSLSLIFQSIELIQYWFQAKLLSKYVSIATLFAYVFVAGYKIFLLITQKSVIWFVLSYTIDYILIAVVLFSVYFKMGGQKLRFSKRIAFDMISKGKYYIISSMMITIFAQVDRIMIKMLIGNTAVGYYASAVTIATLTNFVFSAIIDSFRPVILEKKQNDENEFKRYMTILFGVVIYLSLAQCIFITIFSKCIVNLLYGSEYQNTVSALRIVVWYTTFSYLGSVRNIWILAEEKQKYLWILNASGALGNIILNIILIPVWGINGAALASLITQIFTNIFINQIIKPIRPVNKLLFKGLFIVNEAKNLIKSVFKTRENK